MDRLIVLLLFLFLQPSGISAQDIKFKKLHPEQNLSNGHVQAIFKDSDGYMWFGTINGLNRYDGVTLKVYLADENDSSTISSNSIFEIFNGPGGDLWLKDEEKVFNVYKKDKGIFVRDLDKIKNRFKLKSKEISKVFADSKGRYWFLHPYEGLTLYNQGKDASQFFFHHPSMEGSLSQNSVTDIQEDQNENFWLVYENGSIDILSGKSLKVIDHISIDEIAKTNQFYHFKLKFDDNGDAWIYCPNYALGIFLVDHRDLSITAINEASEGLRLNNSLVKTIMPHSEGNVWIGTDHGGINIINKNKNEVKYLLNQPENPNSLSHNAVYALFEDEQGMVWVGTHKRGVELFHPQSNRFHLVRRDIDPDKPYPSNDVNAFEEDANGNIFVGSNGGGLWKYSPDNGKIIDLLELRKGEIPANTVIVDLFTDHEGMLWVGTYQDGLYALDETSFTHYMPDLGKPEGLKDSNIWKIFEDSKHRLWVGTLREGLFLLDRENDVFDEYDKSVARRVLNNLYVTGVIEDNEGNIWVTGNQGIDVFHPESGFHKYYSGNSQDSSGLSSPEVSDIIIDRKGVIWVSTNKGLCYFDNNSSRFKVFDRSNGLKNEFLVSLVADKKGDLWISSQEGLIHAKIDRSKPLLSAEFRVFNTGDGLQGNYYNKNAAFLSSKGVVFFGGSDGFNFVDPATFSFFEKESRVVFSKFQLFNQPISVNQQVNGRILLPGPLDKNRNIQLNHDENIFSVSFSSMNYLNPDKSSFQYRLEGFNKGWTSLTEAPFEVTFTNLDPGNYKLLVKASNIDGIPGTEIATLSIDILAPFWKTSAAYFTYLVTFIVFLVFAWRWIVAKERLRLSRLEEIKENQRLAELDQMKSRFFTNVSHEFKTPLTLILTPIEKLMEQKGEGFDNFHVKTIQKNAKKLLMLVNQLLDVRNIERQDISLVRSEGDIVSLIEEEVRTFQSLSINTNIGLTFSSNVKRVLCSFDVDKVEKIINNLLSNAFKFTSAGGEVGVCLEFHQEAIDHGILSIEIRDTGVGISKELQGRVFDRYYTSHSNQNQGTGIGLSLVSEFTKMHGGCVTVESEPGKGATFIVSLPLPLLEGFLVWEDFYLEAGKEDLISALPQGEISSKPRLLLVEDNADLRHYLGEVLKDDFQVDQAPDGKVALEMAQNQIPDIVLSDLLMPEMDGAALCKAIKNNLKTSHIPVVLLTAKTAEEDHLLGLASGCNLYLEKPFNLELLSSGLQNLLKDKERLQKHYKKIISVRTSEAELESLDDKLIQKGIAIVENEIENPDFSVEVLSRELGMSRMHLYKKINSLTGQSPLEFIRSIRLQRAAQLLKMNQYFVSEVAYKVGFNNAKYFSKHFKNNFGTLPSQYQKNNNDA